YGLLALRLLYGSQYNLLSTTYDRIHYSETTGGSTMTIIMNEKIKAAEVQLTGINGEALGIIATSEALAMAKKLNVDLVCTSLRPSPPPCRLVGGGRAKRGASQASRKEREPNLKEQRLTPNRG